jgi:rsbT co-antagonist protein RsbR
MARDTVSLGQIDAEQEATILRDWMEAQKKTGALVTGRIREGELQTQSKQFLSLLCDVLAAGAQPQGAAYEALQDMLAEVSRSRAVQGFSPTETARFVLSLKEPLLEALNRTPGKDASAALQAAARSSALLDELSLHTMEVHQKTREEVIIRQQREIAELSTPVVKLWEGVLALPLIGTLDSERTQVVMENLLQTIVTQGAEMAIIDITGVPTVDTLTAQHLLKTVAAARLMGADCIISGIRPQIAQTIVHLGVELNVISKATLADAFALALRRMNRAVVAIKPPTSASEAAG